jgi:hypothetical protein
MHTRRHPMYTLSVWCGRVFLCVLDVCQSQRCFDVNRAAVDEAAGCVVPRAVPSRRAPDGVGPRASCAAHAVLAARAHRAHRLPHRRHAGRPLIMP